MLILRRKREGSVTVFSAKVALALASCSRLQEKYGYLYQQLADHNACLSRAALFSLLNNICKVTDMLGECVAYGSHMVQISVDHCFVEVCLRADDNKRKVNEQSDLISCF